MAMTSTDFALFYQSFAIAKTPLENAVIHRILESGDAGRRLVLAAGLGECDCETLRAIAFEDRRRPAVFEDRRAAERMLHALSDERSLSALAVRATLLYVLGEWDRAREELRATTLPDGAYLQLLEVSDLMQGEADADDKESERRLAL